jgi:hypothetical protein
MTSADSVANAPNEPRFKTRMGYPPMRRCCVLGVQDDHPLLAGEDLLCGQIAIVRIQECGFFGEIS